MTAPIESLLQPTLAPSTARKRPLSPNACFWSAFLGGPVAALATGAVNSARLGRGRRDLLVAGVAVLLSALALALPSLHLVHPEWFPAWLTVRGRLSRHLPKVLGLMVWGLYHLRHRRAHAATQYAGAFAPPWSIAVPAVIGAMLLQLGASLAAELRLWSP